MDNDKKIELLTAAGMAAYGQHWKSELAQLLSINDRSVRQWSNGERPIPDRIMRGILSHLYQRAYQIERHARHLQTTLKFLDRNYQRILFIGTGRPIWEGRESDGPSDETEINWFDIDGQAVGLTPDSRIINHRGEYATACDITATDMLAVMQAHLNGGIND